MLARAMDRRLVMKGKVKEVYDLGDKLEFRFTDNISVFDKVIPSLIPHKGETLCREGTYWFRKAERLGIKTHFLDYIPPNAVVVKKVDIIQPRDITPQTKRYLIPLEFISRWFLAGSLFDRVKEGKMDVSDLDFPKGHKITYGEPLPEPLLEVSTKLEKTDRLLDSKSALQISGLTVAEFDEAKELVLKIDRDLGKSVEKRGLIHVDGKKELAFDERREMMVVDVYGTADEDRFWDKQKYEAGEFVDLSKEYVRQYYRSTGYKDRLYNARDIGQKDPDIPPLPDEIVDQTSRIYIKLFEMITGQKFRP